MRRAADTIGLAGLRLFATTSEAVWGWADRNSYMVTIYCQPARDVAVFVAAGPHRDRTHVLVESLLAAWGRTN
jgi:hypothetical protein